VKEDVPVGILVVITPTGVLLSILIILLSAWMVVFTCLALRRTSDAIVDEREAAAAQPKVIAKQLTSDNFSKIGASAVKSSPAHKKLSSKEAVFEQSMR
jgi:hypothetical protein